MAFEWAELKTLCYVVSFRAKKDEASTAIVKFYISSAELDAKSLLTAAREHWSVENNLHWQLDVSMNEGACRVRQKNSTENLATVRHVALNLLKQMVLLKVELKESTNKRIEVMIIEKRLCQDFLWFLHK